MPPAPRDPCSKVRRLAPLCLLLLVAGCHDYVVTDSALSRWRTAHEGKRSSLTVPARRVVSPGAPLVYLRGDSFDSSDIVTTPSGDHSVHASWYHPLLWAGVGGTLGGALMIGGPYLATQSPSATCRDCGAPASIVATAGIAVGAAGVVLLVIGAVLSGPEVPRGSRDPRDLALGLHLRGTSWVF